MGLRRNVLCAVCVFGLAAGQGAQSATTGGINSIQEEPVREWLTYLASDQLQGRATFSEGLGLAAAYIADHLAAWGVKPIGDNGTYFQTVKVHGVRTTSRASVTVEVNGQSRTFKDGEGVRFPREMGGRQTIAVDRVVFAGYGLSFPAVNHDDYRGLDARGAAVIWLGDGPRIENLGMRRLLSGRPRTAFEKGAVATVSPEIPDGRRGGRAAPPRDRDAQPDAPGDPGEAAGRGRRRSPPDDGDFTSVQPLDRKVPPQVTANDEFFEFLFSGSDPSYASLKERAGRHESLPPFVLKGVRLAFNVDASYEIVRTRFTRNVVGVVEGNDARLKSTYVAYGAHYDHTGYREGAPRGDGAGGASDDRINNGADDDGSGTVGLMAIARAFALGPRPKRSLLFVWHTGEEEGLYGSRFNAEHPVVPLERVAAQINIDMIGRNRNDDPKQSNTVLVVGSDRISTELHNLNEDANASLPRPLTLDYELNDALDPESIYTRSDHYSYAAKGIPIIFLFTGLHADYHRPSDTVDKILFGKLTRVARLAYETGRRVANLEHMPVRDNKGARVGRTMKGRIGAKP